jgi:fatty acid desaturase
MGSSVESTSLVEDAGDSELRRYIRSESIKVPRELTTRSTLWSLGYVVYAHAWIGLSVLVGRFVPGGPLLALVAAFPPILAAQRCLQTLVHHLSHDVLSKRRKLNDGAGNFLVAGFIGMRLQNYRRVHFQHHAENGSTHDPEFFDFSTVEAQGGMLRYVLHFVLGGEALTLVKKYYLSGGAKKSEGPQTRAERGDGSGLVAKAGGMLHVALCQLLLVAVFVFVAKAWFLYLIWMYVAVSWSPMLSRLRFLVEHPGLGDRTVSSDAPAWERLYFAPYQFNYHFEHHAWPGVPPYRLARVHRFLLDRGFFERHPEYVAGTFLGSLAQQVRAVKAAASSTLGS